MRVKHLIIAAFVMILSCSGSTINGRNLSYLGLYSSPEKIITTLKDNNNGAREHFMLGLAYKKQKKYKSSMLHFANSCFTSHRNMKLKLYPQPLYKFLKGFHFKSDYYDDAVYEIASLLYLYREHDYVNKLVGLISDENRSLYLDAKLLETRSLTVLKKYDAAISSLRKILDEYDDPSSASVILIRLASVHEKKKEYKKASASYLKILDINKKGWQSQVAASRIKYLLSEKKVNVEKSQYLPLGRALFHAGKYRETIEILQGTVPEGELSMERDRLLVKSYTGTRKKRESSSIIKKYKKHSPGYNSLTMAVADEHWEKGAKYKSIPIYKELLKKGDISQKEQSLRRIAVFMEDRRLKGYMDYLMKYKNTYGENSASEYFLWLMGRNCIRDKKYHIAEQHLRELLQTFPAGEYTGRSRFWLYKLYSMKGQKNKAHTMMKELITKNPDSSYSWLLLSNISKKYSTAYLKKQFKASLTSGNNNDVLFYHTLLFAREKNIKERDKRLKRIDTGLKRPYRNLDEIINNDNIPAELEAVEKYFVIGYRKGITRSLKLYPDKEKEAELIYAALARYGARYDNYFTSVYNIHELMKHRKLRENISLMPLRSLKMLFPVAFPENLDASGKKYGIKKNRILSVIKAESLFNNRAISPAGAIGLMQLMPATAGDIAGKLKIKEYDLKDPGTSIEFGTNYIAWLKKYFKNNFSFMVAGYNAGAGNVNKWKKRLDLRDLDFFTEFVPFNETRYYILRTRKFLTQYDMIYGSK